MPDAPPTTSGHRRYASMDGLRGFAAISVVVYHLGHWLDVPLLAANSGLAVDLFFCLSGYVLPLAYGRQFRQGLTSAGFLRLRLVRLMPLVVAAVAISGTYVAFRTSVRPDRSLSASTFITGVILALLNLPYFGAPVALGGPELFPLNGPQYTLFLELVINAVWCASSRVRQFGLACATAAPCVLVLCMTGLGGDVAGTFWSGFPRVGASFFLGVAIFHGERHAFAWLHGRLPAERLFWCLIGTMAILFYLPAILPLPVQIFWVAVLSPLLVLAAARTEVRGSIQRVFTYLGDLSYPLYALHYPLFCWVNGAYRMRFGPQNPIIEIGLSLFIDLAACHFALRFYDEPVRRELGRWFALASKHTALPGIVDRPAHANAP